MPRINNIQLRRGTYSEWDDKSSEVLASGEPGFITDFHQLKIGDGVTQWDDLVAVNDALTTVVRNNTDIVIPKMSVVYINGSQGDLPTIALALANSESSSTKTYGITAAEIAPDDIGYVVVEGALKNLNTSPSFDGVSPGTTLWLSPTVAGGITTTKPYAPNHMVSLGNLIRIHNQQGVIEVKIQNGFELEELHNVAATGVSNNQYLIYNSGTKLWTPTSTGIFSNTYTNQLFMTHSGENISGSYLRLYQYDDQPTSLLQLNQSNLQIIGVSGSSLSSQDPTKYPQISFNNLSYVDFNRSAIRLTGYLTTGGSAGPSWPIVTSVASQAMSSGIFFEDRLWKPSSYNPADGFAYDATSQIVSTASDTVAGYTKLSFLVQTAPDNSGVPLGSYVERFYIGSDGITNVNGTIKANQGEMDSLVLDEGGLTVNRGIIQVNNSFDNNFVMMINSSGLNISASYEFITDYADSVKVVTPVQLLQAASITPSTITVFFDGLTEEDLTVDKTVLIRNASNSISNGIYIIAAGGDSNTIRFNRHSSYLNGSIVKNEKVFGVRSNGGSYVLNIQLPLNEDGIIGTDILDFSPFGGNRAVAFNASADAEFSAAVYAKEKYFRIQHPDPESSYKYLQYGSLESPYHGVRLTGEAELKNGNCIIKLPTYLKHLIHDKDINIQLTNKGHHKILYLDKIDLKNDRFIVKGYRSKTGGPFAFFWCFTGVRKDVDPLIPEY